VITLVLALVTGLSAPTVHPETAFQRTEFRPVRQLEALPSRLISALAKVTGKERIANPSERWQPTDNLVDGSLPRRRLILAGVSKSMSFVYYEHGGRGKHEHLILFSGNQTSGFRPIGNFSMSHGPADIKGLKAYLAAGKASRAVEA
jgi:hypothetical protein